MNKKRIILIDRPFFIVETIAKMPDVEIVLHEAGYAEEQMKKAQSRYKNHIKYFHTYGWDSEENFLKAHETDYELTDEDVEKYRIAQLKTEYYGHRELADDSTIQFRYYSALRYFLGIFEREKIDMVYSTDYEHGGLFDVLIYEIAKSRGIPSYLPVLQFFTDQGELLTLKEYGSGKMVNISRIGIEKLNSKDFFHSLISYASSYRIPFLGEKLVDCIKFYGKSLMLNMSYLARRMDDSERKKFASSLMVSKRERVDGYVYISKLWRYYRRCASPADYSTPYIYYPLHQEPEASIMTRNWMGNQLYIIQLLSESLPEGWKLYVKEHPSTFNVYERPGGRYFYKNISYYRAPRFYSQIQRFKNTELISMKETSYDLMEHARAVASICGTALMEAVVRHKPILVFGKELLWLERLKEAHVVCTSSEVRAAMAKIQENPTPNYSDADEVFQNYVFCAGKAESCVESSTRATVVRWLLEQLPSKDA